MEILVSIIDGIAKCIGNITWAYCICYTLGIITKTVLVVNGDADPDELTDWTELGSFFRRKKNKSDIL